MDKIEFSTFEISASIEEIIAEGGHFTLCVSGSSMNPFLVHGRDFVRLIKCNPQDLKKGRILLFKRASGELVLHRVMRVLSDGRLIMNGDAQVWCETISSDMVIAAVSDIECNGKSVSCSSFKYRTKIFLWQLLFPIRSLIFRVRSKIKRITKKKD